MPDDSIAQLRSSARRRTVLVAAIVAVLVTASGALAIVRRDDTPGGDVAADIPVGQPDATDAPVPPITADTTIGPPLGQPTPNGWREGAPFTLDRPDPGAYLNGDADLFWTGDRVLVWNGLPRHGTTTTETAPGASPIYDPVRNAWQVLDDPPVDVGAGSPAWSGDELIVAGWGQTSRTFGAAALDPVTGTWRPLGPPEAELRLAGLGEGLWTGDGVAYWTTQTLTTYDQATDVWRPVVGYPDGLAPEYNDAVWIGTELFAVDTLDAPRRPVTPAAEVIDRTTGMARRVADPPVRLTELVWTGTAVIGIADDGSIAAWNPTTDAWTVGTPAPFAPRGYESQAGLVAWTGDRLVVWGGLGGAPTELEPHAFSGPVEVDGGLYDPTTDAWTAIPALDVDVHVDGIDTDEGWAGGTARAVWANGRLVVLVPNGDGFRTFLWSPPT